MSMLPMLESKDYKGSYLIMCGDCEWRCITTLSTMSEATAVKDEHDCEHPGPSEFHGSMVYYENRAARRKAARESKRRDTPTGDA